jgi:FkbM family methyltransferase
MIKIIVHIERFLARILGKGWGAATIDTEVSLCIQSLNNRNNPVVFDVGANTGNWTSSFCSKIPNSTLVMFEPSFTNIEKLKIRYQELNLSPNNIMTGKKYLIPLALSSFVSEQKLYSDTPGSGLASLTKRDISFHNINHGHHSEIVKITTLDLVTKELGISYIDILKMDVEGHELDVLNGGIELLESSRIGRIQFEFGGCNIDTRTYLKDFYIILEKYNFTLFRMSPIGLIPVKNYYEGLECFDCTNYLAIHKSQNKVTD